MPTTFPAMGGGLWTPPPISPVAFDVLGTPQIAGTGTPRITPTPGSDVFADIYILNGLLAAPYNTAVLYNGSPMTVLAVGDVGWPANLGVYRYWIPKVSGATGSIAISATAGSAGANVVPYSYKNVGAVYFNDIPLQVNGTTFSHAAVPPTNGMALWSAFGTQPITAHSGGTSRYLNSSAAEIPALQDSAVSATFSDTVGASGNWGGLLTYLSPVTPTGIYLMGLWNGPEGSKGNPTALGVMTLPGSLIICDVATTGGTVTGVTSTPVGGSAVAMTQLGTIGFNNGSAGNLYRYYLFDPVGGYPSITVSSGGDTWYTVTTYMGVTSIGAAQTAYGLTTGNPAVATQSVTCSPGQKIVQTFVTDTIINTNSVAWTPSGGLNLVNYTSDGGVSRLMTISEADASTTFNATSSGTGGSTGNYAAIACVLS